MRILLNKLPYNHSVDLSGLIWNNLHNTLLREEKKKYAAYCRWYDVIKVTERIHSYTLAYL